MQIDRESWLSIFCCVSLCIHLLVGAFSRTLGTPVLPKQPAEIEVTLEASPAGENPPAAPEQKPETPEKKPDNPQAKPGAPDVPAKPGASGPRIAERPRPQHKTVRVALAKIKPARTRVQAPKLIRKAVEASVPPSIVPKPADPPKPKVALAPKPDPNERPEPPRPKPAPAPTLTVKGTPLPDPAEVSKPQDETPRRAAPAAEAPSKVTLNPARSASTPLPRIAGSETKSVVPGENPLASAAPKEEQPKLPADTASAQAAPKVKVAAAQPAEPGAAPAPAAPKREAKREEAPADNPLAKSSPASDETPKLSTRPGGDGHLTASANPLAGKVLPDEKPELTPAPRASARGSAGSPRLNGKPLLAAAPIAVQRGGGTRARGTAAGTGAADMPGSEGAGLGSDRQGNSVGLPVPGGKSVRVALAAPGVNPLADRALQGEKPGLGKGTEGGVQAANGGAMQPGVGSRYAMARPRPGVGFGNEDGSGNTPRVASRRSAAVQTETPGSGGADLSQAQGAGVRVGTPHGGGRATKIALADVNPIANSGLDGERPGLSAGQVGGAGGGQRPGIGGKYTFASARQTPGPGLGGGAGAGAGAGRRGSERGAGAADVPGEEGSGLGRGPWSGTGSSGGRTARVALAHAGSNPLGDGGLGGEAPGLGRDGAAGATGPAIRGRSAALPGGLAGRAGGRRGAGRAQAEVPGSGAGIGDGGPVGTGVGSGRPGRVALGGGAGNPLADGSLDTEKPGAPGGSSGGGIRTGEPSFSGIAGALGSGSGAADGAGSGLRPGKVASAEVPGLDTGLGGTVGAGAGIGSGVGIGRAGGSLTRTPGRGGAGVTRGIPFSDIKGILGGGDARGGGGKGEGSGDGAVPGEGGAGTLSAGNLGTEDGTSPVARVNIVYILDVSQSMAWDNKLARAKEALKTAIGELDSVDSFNVIDFASDIRVLSSEMMVPSPDNVRKASDYLDKLLVRAETNMSAALEAALALKPVTHVFIVTDGAPTSGVKQADKLRVLVKRLNAQKAQIITVGLGTGANFPGAGLLEGLARDSGGQFNYINIKKIERGPKPTRGASAR